MKRLAITGANGYLASLVQMYNKDRFEFVRVSRKDVDYTDLGSVRSYFENLDFDIMFHTAANATTADCENDPEGTHRVNCDAAIEIARICKERGCRMIFISTEQIFNGKTEPGPFAEDAEPASVTNYGMQKAEVDSWMQQNMEDYLVLRFSWMFGMPMPHVKPSPGIMGNVIKALRTDTPALFTANEKRCMTYAQHLADQFAAISELPSGVYHFASQNELSTYEAAKLIGSKLIEAGITTPEQVERCILPNTERYADRFRDFRMDATKIKQAGIELGTFESDVDRCLADFGWK
ncbi:SDR family oxidoreductase [Enorma phocaeensis]|uniref:SDR family oxidoreductase n=1 Tax=Enorma phocaeensis TaxID=1871019 RepID=UPI003208BC3F